MIRVKPLLSILVDFSLKGLVNDWGGNNVGLNTVLRRFERGLMIFG